MAKIIRLDIIDYIKKNLSNSANLIQVVLGPRQVGKTTSVLSFLQNEFNEDYHYVSADGLLENSSLWLREQWQTAKRKEALLVVDEVQKIENWSETVKLFWDLDKKENKPIRCILLGSSLLDIQRGLTESLTGRFQLIRAYHWNFRESKEAYNLDFDSFLKFGGYPGSYTLIENEGDWIGYVKKSIIETVIEKDILMNNTVKSPAIFKQAFEILVSYPAQEVSYTKLLGQLQNKGNTELIKHYLSLYEGAFLFKTLEKFSTNKIKIKSSSPKILPLAPSLYYLTIQDDYRADEKGRVFELVVGAQLVRLGLDLYYWRERENEVDFVLKKGRNIWAIEVKSGKKKKSRGLEKFLGKFPQAKAVIITLDNYLEFERDPLAFLMNS